MTVTIEVACRYCHQTEPVRKHGTSKAGFPRYYCKDCQKTFQLNYLQMLFLHAFCLFLVTSFPTTTNHHNILRHPIQPDYSIQSHH
ncbi:transposase [Xenorhabdus beddingii]|uniref:Transposase n=1 Tax=Xenorhabdus beddingii TaxID=40578 RepID=A0A1Y2SQL5_9GAMM|nr:transposase [Xenorhabdus beddingii]